MPRTVLLGDPARFRIKSGANPHTRTRWGFRKQVDRSLARAQWLRLSEALQQHGVVVHVIPASEEWPGLVFPANAGFRFESRFILSRLHSGRAGEIEQNRHTVAALGLEPVDFPDQLPFEGEADFFPVGDPSGARVTWLFTYGRLERPRWVPRFGWPPYRRIYGFRSDVRAVSTLRRIVQPLEVLPLELSQEAHYHGDTVLCSFGPHREFLLAYLEGLTERSRRVLCSRFGDRLIPLSPEDAARFAANSFSVGQVLLMPDGLTQDLYEKIRRRGVVPFPIDVSEFLEKGGGAVKCMLLDLGEL